MNRLEDLASELTKGQTQIVNVIHDLSRMGERIGKLEERQDEVRKFMWKAMGAVGVAGTTLPVIGPQIIQYLFK